MHIQATGNVYRAKAVTGIKTVTDILMFGAGGHAAAVSDVIRDIEDFNISGVIDDSPSLQGKCLFGSTVIGGRQQLYMNGLDTMAIFLGIGDNLTRARIARSLGGREFPVLVHPTAHIGTNVSLGEGTVVMPRAIIENGARVGAHCIINNGAVVGHGSVVGDYSHVSGNAVLAGGVNLGERCLIGIGGCVLPNVAIGQDSIVSAGSVANRSAPERHYIMSPGSRIFRRFEK
ncbi:NeuD/PglB/VioB family sugar acetyltransferase [Thiohalomonas denitrificans]|uniref:Sugar O-acyltransferase, sialic acid O-acetyltransferase NeuD family n=1 Tax=Thiohalomonas denitrificans TaxID=415747 RepID=A0A1G5QHW5_9GAMM|nr:NeuD/PglB/VioB family sugar acetyltransferase [Thiohalomonas denitrificans]SCZ61465.1 sugar O-acyltransferase, sialic acid O-acetyltransferase NeuD family [Thiohalomonas denitrificans]